MPLQAGQAFELTAIHYGNEQSYFVRCLPKDFSVWDYTRLAQPSHGLYVVAPTLGGPSGKYVVIFDDHGVPVWWLKTSEVPFDAKILADGTVGWTEATYAQIRELDGTLLRTVQTVGVPFDFHDLVVLPNGNILLVSYPVRKHVDLTAYGKGADETVYDSVVQEIDPEGKLVWSWNSKDHIGLEETGRWYSLPSPAPPGITDLTHINAVEPVGDDSVLISLRHTDAVYRLDKATGEVVWKLGGTTRPESLEVLDDPEGEYPFGGQHDVRLQPDGTITVYDNRTQLSGRPRAVRYEVDEADGTATLLEEVTDPEVASSFCCGSARRSADGSWLMSWGGVPLVTEFDAGGDRTFKLSFGSGPFSYRATPVADGLVTIGQVRAGMNSMNPR